MFIKDEFGQTIAHDVSVEADLPTGSLVRHFHIDGSDAIDIIRHTQLPAGSGRSSCIVIGTAVHYYLRTESESMLHEMMLDKTQCTSQIIMDPLDGSQTSPFPEYPYVLSVQYEHTVDVRAERARHLSVPQIVTVLIRCSDAAVSEAFTRERLWWGRLHSNAV